MSYPFQFPFRCFMQRTTHLPVVLSLRLTLMHRCIKFILFWNDTLHVSDSLSAHHPEFKTVHTALKQILLSACQRVPASMHTAVSVWQMPVAVCTVLNCWWWTERPSETCSVIPEQNKFETLVRLVDFTIEMYCTSQSSLFWTAVGTWHILKARTVQIIQNGDSRSSPRWRQYRISCIVVGLGNEYCRFRRQMFPPSSRQK